MVGKMRFTGQEFCLICKYTNCTFIFDYGGCKRHSNMQIYFLTLSMSSPFAPDLFSALVETSWRDILRC